MATVPGGEIERYVVWLRNLLAEYDASGADSRALLTRVVADLAAGRQTICGAFIPSEVIGSLTTQLLPELEAALDQLGGPLSPPPPPPVKWPDRSNREVRELVARLAELPAVDTLPPFRTRRRHNVGGLLAVVRAWHRDAPGRVVAGARRVRWKRRTRGQKCG